MDTNSTTQHTPSQPTNLINCQTCRMSNLCLPLAIDAQELYKLDELIRHSNPLQPRETIFSSGTPFTSIYAVRSGSVKSFFIDPDNHEQITGFYLPGEIFGWDGIAEDQYQTTAIALETSSVCEIPYDKLEQLSDTLPEIKRHVMKLISREINSDQQFIALLAGFSAQQKLASLILSFSDRMARQKRSPTRLWLPMSRIEISNYLGLTIETVSRVFGRLHKNNILKVNKREVEILDKKRLENLTTTSGN
jgi:CRP/FNR family transcriptional regulator, anaerobic regulatory protein